MKTFLRKSRIFAIVFVIANLFFSSAAFGQETVTEPTVTLDQTDLDYAPGETVYITGTGWKPGELVTLEVDNLTNPDVDCGVYNPGPHELWTTVADGNGNFAASWYVNDCELGANLMLEAYGKESGFTFEIFFTDATWTLGLSSNTFCGGETKNITFTITQTNNANPRNQSFSISVPSGFTISSPSTPSISGKSWSSSSINATTVCLAANNPGNINELVNNNVLTFSANVTAPNVAGSFVLSGNGTGSQTCSTSGGQAIANPPSFAVSGSSGIDESYAILNINGATTFYDLKATTGNADFQGNSFGIFNSSQTFQLKGAQQKIFKCGTRDITNGTLYYRIYPSASPSGLFSTNSMGYVSGSTSGSCTNQIWEQSGSNTNILNGLCDGNYTIEVYTAANYTGCGSGEHLANNEGANYKATFTVKNDDRSGIYQSAIILKPNGGGDTYYDLQVNTPNNDFTGSIGSFCQTGSLIVAGAENKVFKCSPNDITGNSLRYRVYSGSPIGSFQTVGLGHASDDGASVCGGLNQTWRSTSNPTNILTGLAPGTYTLEVYTEAAYSSNGICAGTHYSNNGGANYKATFTVLAAPIITTTYSNITVNNDVGQCGAAVSYAAAAATGSPTPEITYSTASGSLFPVGITTVTVTATNSCGVDTKTFTVTVTDNQIPVITSNGNKNVNNDSNVCGATVLVSATATDNCNVGIPTGVRSDALALTAVYPIGTTTITWNVSDSNANAATAVIQNITVEDNVAPVAIAQAVTVQLDNLGAGSVNATQVDNGSNDACGIQSLSVSPNTFTCANVGANTVTLTVTD
ncbi:MAG: hypothetical protein C0412_08480, partial [Flavobacterium sp.]|nr:hypothetical protein [Flavobacterium sp.]